MDLLTGAVLGGASLLGSIFNWQSQKDTNSLNVDLFNNQKDFTKEMWNANNEYNTPLNQKNRLVQAGFNPLLAVGGINSGNSSAPAQAPNTPNLQAPQLDLNSPANSFIQAQQTDIAKQNADTQQSSVENQNKNRDIQIKALKDLNDVEIQNKLKDLGYKDKQIDQIIAAIKYTEKQTEYQEILNKYADERQKAEIAETNSRSLLNMISGQESMSRKAYVDKTTKWYDSFTAAQIQNLKASSNLSNVQAKRLDTLLPAELKKLQVDAHQIQCITAKTITENIGLSYDNQLKKFEYNLMKETGYKSSGSQLDPLFRMCAQNLYSLNPFSPGFIGQE